MAYVYANSKIIPGSNIPEVAIDCLREFVKKTDYKGDIILPIGPYDYTTYSHVVYSLELLIRFGRIEKITGIDIKKDSLSLKLQSGESHTVATKPLSFESNLKKIAKSYRKKFS